MKKPRVLLDCDGVVADFLGYYLRILNSVTGNHYTSSDVQQFQIEEALELSEDVSDVVFRAISLPGVAQKFEVLPGALEAVARLREIAQVVFVTSAGDTALSSPTWCYDRMVWCRANFGNVPVVLAHEKEFVAGDVLVDDKPKNVKAWKEEYPDKIAVLWGGGGCYNKTVEVAEFMALGLDNWGELIKLVEGLCPKPKNAIRRAVPIEVFDLPSEAAL